MCDGCTCSCGNKPAGWADCAYHQPKLTERRLASRLNRARKRMAGRPGFDAAGNCVKCGQPDGWHRCVTLEVA